MALNVYGDITPRQAAYSMANLLKRALPLLTIERFGQAYPIPKNNTQVAKFRRYFLEAGTGSYSGNAGEFNIPLATAPLVEGVTPAGRKFDSKDYTVNLNQYGDFLGFTDVIMDTHEDFPAILREMTDMLGEQAAVTLETLRYNVIRAGTNVFYANGEARAEVNTALSLPLQRRITRALKNQNAKHFTQVMKSSVNYNTQPIEACFIALVHPNLENDVRNMDGFISTKHYAGATPFDGEIGAVEDVRYVSSTVFTGWEDAGGAAGDMMSSTGAAADVYPAIFLARDAFGTVPLKGDNVAQVMVVKPTPTNVDPLAQRGTAGWKAWNATVILQDAWLIRAEVAATE